MINLQKADPRVVIISGLFISAAAVIVRDVFTMLALFVVSLAFAELSGVSFKTLVLRLRRFGILLIIVALLQSVFIHSGTVLLSIASWPLVTVDGLLASAAVFLRMAILIMSGSAIVKCGFRRGIQGLTQLHVPYEIAFMTYIAIHFIPLLSEEMKDAMIAMQLKGIDIKRIKLSNRIRVYSYLFIPVISGCITKARDLSAAIELKGLRAYPNRTSLYVLKMKTLDYIFTASVAFCAVAIVLAERIMQIPF